MWVTADKWLERGIFDVNGDRRSYKIKVTF